MLINLLPRSTLPVRLNAVLVPVIVMVVPTRLLVLMLAPDTLPDVLICPEPANRFPPVMLAVALT